MAFTEEQQAAIDRARQTRIQGEVAPQKLRSFTQGLTFGFGDEIEAYLRSLGGPQEEYESIRDNIRGKLQEYREANPTASIGLETIGAVAPTALSLLTGVGAGAGAANIGRMATLGGRVPRLAQGITTGAAYGGLYGAGTAEGGISERLSQAQEFAGTGALFGAGGQAALGITRGLAAPIRNVFSKSKNENDVQKILEQIEKVSDNAYEQLNKSNIRISQSSARNFLDEALEDMKQNFGFDPNLSGVSAQAQRLTQQSIDDFENIIGARTKSLKNFVDEEVEILRNNGVSESFIKKELENLNSSIYMSARNRFNQSQNIAPKEFSLRDLNELNKRLGQRLRTANRGNLGLDAVNIERLKIAIQRIIDSSDEASPLWLNARGLWNTRKNFEMISEELDKAIRKVQGSGLGTDNVSIYKSMANSILNNKSKRNFLRDSDVEALEAIVRGGPVDNILQALGRYAPTASNTMRAMTLVGSATSSGATLPFSMLAWMARNSANKNIASKAQNLLQQFIEGDETMVRELGNAFRQVSFASSVGLSPISGAAQLSGRAAGPLMSINQDET